MNGRNQMTSISELKKERAELIRALTCPENECLPKGVKESLLRSLRAIERQLGIEGQPYNSSAFGKDYGGNGR